MGVNGKIGNGLRTLSRLCRVILWTITLGVLSAGGLGIRSASAAPPNPLLLNLTGPNNAQVGQPLGGIVVRLINKGLPTRSSRLRLFVHDGADRDLKPGDISVAIKEGNTWKEVELETIDGGFMGAIGEAGKIHGNPHQRGGFDIGDKVTLVWQLRVTFLLPGHYSLVAAVSPDNGSTHLAQPVILDMDVL